MSLAHSKRDLALNIFLVMIVLTAGITNIFFAGGRLLVSMLPLVALFGAFALFVPVRQWLSAIKFRPQDYALIFFFTFSALSAIALPNSKALIYLVVYYFSFVGLGIMMRNIIEKYGNWQWLNWANLIAIVLTSLFCIAEFSFEFLMNKPSQYVYDLQFYIPRSSPWDGQGYCGSIPRVFGLSIEPTYMGWYFNTLGFLALFFLWKEVKFGTYSKTALTTIIALAYSLTWSTSSWLFLACGLVFAFGAYAVQNGLKQPFPWRAHSAKPLYLSLAMIVGFWTFIAMGERQLLQELPSCFQGLQEKVTLSKPENENASLSTQIEDLQTGQITPARKKTSQSGPNSDPSQQAGKDQLPSKKSATGSSTGEHTTAKKSPKKLLKSQYTRSRIWRDDFNGALKKPFLGHGIGFLSSVERSSSLNLFLFIAYEQGVLAMISLLVYYIVTGWFILKSTSPYRLVFIVTYVAGGLHLLTMTQHYYFNMWVMIGLFYLSETLSKSSIPGKQSGP